MRAVLIDLASGAKRSAGTEETSMPDLLQTIAVARQELAQLETHLQGAVAARWRFEEASRAICDALGADVSPLLDVSPEPSEERRALTAPVVAPASEEAPPPAVVARPQSTAAAPVNGLQCYRKSESRDAGPCRGAVARVRCEHEGCTWWRDLCLAHREGGREAMARSAHVRVAHSPGGKARMKALQDKTAAAHRKVPQMKTLRRAAIAARAKRAVTPESEPRRRRQASPSHEIARAARDRAKAGGDPGAWRGGRVPGLVRCRLPDVEHPGVPCGALVMPGKCAEHLADVHHHPNADKVTIAASFVQNNPAHRCAADAE